MFKFTGSILIVVVFVCFFVNVYCIVATTKTRSWTEEGFSSRVIVYTYRSAVVVQVRVELNGCNICGCVSSKRDFYQRISVCESVRVCVLTDCCF